MAAPKGNSNAQKWTFETAKALFEKCLETSADKSLDCNDFIGEVAQHNSTTLYILNHLTDTFPELKQIYANIKSNCESNCFANGKKGNINAGMAIMNLKSNHGWTDRSQIESNVTINPIISFDPLADTDEADNNAS